MTRLGIFCSAITVFVASACTAAGAVPPNPPAQPGDTATRRDAATARTAAWFEAHRDNLPLLRSFIVEMPKGGDIHNHLSGAVYAENYIRWAAEEGFCVDMESASLGLVSCKGKAVPVAEVMKQPALYNLLIDKMSVRNLAFAGRSGHDQFFAAFGKFGPVSGLRVDNMVVDVASRAASENTQYLELMMTLRGREVRAIGQKIGMSDNLAETRQKLLDAGLSQLVAQGRGDIDNVEAELAKLMQCDDPEAALPACDVTVRYLQQTLRTRPPAEVFAQFVYAFEVVAADPRVVGLNLVAPEDDLVSLRDYSRHMEMLRFLSSQRPEVPIALHAGELTLGMVRPEDLRFHIRQAVEIAGARRIGHGVAISYEDESLALLETMKERDVAVEICLTSNDVILGVKGPQHPISLYRHAGVAMILATDDAGVSRIDLSHEYMRAAVEHGMGYRELKQMARNSLGYSFLPGASLWSKVTPSGVVDACAADVPGAKDPSPGCRRFLAASAKAREQWRLEARLAEFERLSFWHPDDRHDAAAKSPGQRQGANGVWYLDRRPGARASE